MSDKSQGAKNSVVNNANRENTGNTNVTTGIYMGMVKNNIDPARRGRLQVFIPDLGGVEDDPATWRTVAYAGPFQGSTGFAKSPPANKWLQTVHTYGMWFSSPDINNYVLCTFLSGDPARGFWFACVGVPISHYMIPGVIGAIKPAYADDIPDSNDNIPGDQYPVVEYNETKSDNNAFEKFPFNKKPVHKLQWKILYDQQGLEMDTIRGANTSTSHRESPSTVFGISTPGRPFPDKTGTTPDAKQINAREGGHSFVMDDGDLDGIDQHFRLRSAGGHQLMMNDTEEIIYIINSAGTSWLEFAADGKIHIYAEDSVNLRTKKDLNLHSDVNMNIHSDDTISIYAKNAIKLETKLFRSRASVESYHWGQKVEIGSATNMDIHAVEILNQKSKIVDINASVKLAHFGQLVDYASGSDMNIHAIGTLNQKAATIQINGSTKLAIGGQAVEIQSNSTLNSTSNGDMNLKAVGTGNIIMDAAIIYENDIEAVTVSACAPSAVTPCAPPIVEVPPIFIQNEHLETTKTANGGKSWEHGPAKYLSILPLKHFATHEPSWSIHKKWKSGAYGPIGGPGGGQGTEPDTIAYD